MKPLPLFTAMPPSFWAHVRLVSQWLGYSAKRVRNGPPELRLRRFRLEDVRACLEALKLRTDHLMVADPPGSTTLGEALCAYLNQRAEVLEQSVEPNLMNRDQAKADFERLRQQLCPTCTLPMNKQSGEKSHPAYLVGIINMLTQHALDGKPFDDNPGELTVATADGMPLRTFSRWMDGGYPSIVNPSAVWEVKEYYGTTTFGSRVADGVYETMLDGYEFRELEEHESRRILHYLIVDDHFTWWVKGKSYLCRIFDMLHMGLVDEVLFGREVFTRWPEIVRSWP